LVGGNVVDTRHGGKAPSLKKVRKIRSQTKMGGWCSGRQEGGNLGFANDRGKNVTLVTNHHFGVKTRNKKKQGNSPETR